MRKVWLGATIFLAALCIGVIPLALNQRMVENQRKFETHMQLGNKIMLHFDIPESKHNCNVSKHKNIAKNALLEYQEAEQYGDPGIALLDAQEKYNWFCKQEQMLIEKRFKDGYQRYKKVSNMFDDAIDKRRQMK